MSGVCGLGFGLLFNLYSPRFLFATETETVQLLRIS